jgi:hypothetical protein
MRPGPLSRAVALLFVGSTMFPIVAGLLHMPQPPRWLGVADVIVAAVLAVAVIVASARYSSAVTDEEPVAAHRVSARVLAVVPVLLAVFLMTGNRLDWTVLVVGLAWRGWLLLSVLPVLLVMQRLEWDTTRTMHR